MCLNHLLAVLTVPVLFLCAATFAKDSPSGPLPGTRVLKLEGDIASLMVDGVDRFLLRKLDESIAGRQAHWNRDLASTKRYQHSIEPNRKRLKHILGLHDPRVAFDAPQLLATTSRPALVGKADSFEIFAVRWPTVGDMHAEGLLVVPIGRPAIADVVAIPDADQLPEQITGLIEGVPSESQFARHLAASGCRVLAPVLIDRRIEQRKHARLTNREYLYRPSYELGRHLIGYELQKVLAAVDWFTKDAGGNQTRIGVMGYGEGGLIALYGAALDSRIDVACVSGHFAPRQDIWQEPIDRNVYGLLEQFGDAELASMVVPHPLIIEAARGPELVLPSEGGAPARLKTPPFEMVRREFQRAVELAGPMKRMQLIASSGGTGPFGSPQTLGAFLTALAPESPKPADPGPPPQHLYRNFDPDARQMRQIHEIDRHNQWLLRESSYVRNAFMKNLDTSSLEKYEKSVEWYRDYFRHEVIGHFDDPLLRPDVRSRKIHDEPGWTGYEVVMDVFEDVIAYGILLVPKSIEPGERRPVVVCQHGLEGRPQEVVAGDSLYYHNFAARLVERGFVIFAPQNLYLFKDRFRTLQRKANPLKKTIFSIMVPQHQQIVDWLQSLPFVNPDRVAFYGLSYGGKTAMRVPPLVEDYCLSICSADFNDWVDKNASTRSPYSYVWTTEYEMFDFDLASTFSYAEMASLICPRPFMVERGHHDGVANDKDVAAEFAKVRYLYQATGLGLTDRCRIEFFNGPHTINAVGTFDFLHHHLNLPKPTGK